MIGRLSGTILEKQPPLLLVDVQGVGYEVFAPMSTFYQLPDLNQTVTLHTHLVVREDAQLLYGFHETRERELFRALIKVNGVGPKLALTILSGMSPSSFVRCVRTNDSSTLINIPGIGKKTAERLVIEMRDSLAKWSTQESTDGTATPMQADALQEAIGALIALGYKPNEAKKAVANIHDAKHSSEQLIRLALQQMVKGA